MTSLSDYPRRYCSVCRSVVVKKFKPGPRGRPDARCPKCGSLERHRFLAVLLDVLTPMVPDIGVLVDVAPSPQTTELLEGLEPRLHTRIDIGFDNRSVDILGSLTALPYRDDSADLLVCYHVLEHIRDDRDAMAEIARVLKPGGLGLLQVPFRAGRPTDEDPSAGKEERIERFGRHDHVRFYGDDFEDRLVESGLAIQRVTPLGLLGPEMVTWLRLSPDEAVWLVRPVADAAVPAYSPATGTALTSTLDAALEQLALQHRKLLRARERIEELGRENARLREEQGRSVVTAGRTALRRAAGRVTGRNDADV